MFPKSRALLSTQIHVAILVAIIVAPVLILAAVLFFSWAEAERARSEASMQEKARTVKSAIDRELAGLQYTLYALASAPALETQDLRSFHEYIKQVGSARNAIVVLRNRQSQQVLNNVIEWGQPLPPATALRSTDERVASSLRVEVSELFHGLQVRRPSFAVVSPIVQGDKLAYFLSLSLATQYITDILLRSNLEGGEIAAVIDGNGIIVARSRDNDVAVATPSKGAMMRAPGREGRIIAESLNGEPVVTFFSRSDLSNWTIGISVPITDLEAPVVRTVKLVAIISLILLVISVGSAIILARMFSRPIEALAVGADALGQGQPIKIRPTSVKEIHSAWVSLKRAADKLRERTEQRDLAESALLSLNNTLEDQVRERTAELQATNSRLIAEMKQREDVEERVRQLQKSEAVSQLTGGIAHDFNNMLAAILGSLSLIESRMAKGDTNIGMLVKGGIDSANRAAQLTKRLLAFSRQQPLSPKPVEPNKLIQGMSELLKRTMPELVSMETVLAAGAWRIHVDANQLENAILNLAVNARDAMVEGGKLTIETSNAYLDEAYAADHGDLTPGQYVLLAVTDTGTGMPPAVLSRAFDPFFTTKPDGRGTGLGLSQVHGFIKQSGGHIKIYSEPGLGTTVKLYLPRFFGEDTEEAPGAQVPLQTSAEGELVLIVEDDDAVRATTVELVRELGYRVLEANSAAAALRILDAEPKVRLLFTDVVMPELNGRKLVDEALKRRPDLKVLFTTGYTRNAIVHNGVLDQGVNLIVKPFTLDMLGLKIAEALRG
ncbi:ATP-binding protein [Lacibacterium aquatile]|uniref:histidine kinase n=1 Tax=Lacibacterium aquatile TaxID=1168082 RepID=A0ABW5DRG4_9PROT